MDILTILFTLVFVVFLPLGQVFRIPFGNGFSLVGLDLAVITSAILWIVLQIVKKKKPTFLFLPIGVFFGAGILSLLVNVSWLKGINLFISILYLFRWGAYACFIWITKDVVEKKRDFSSWLLVGGGGLVMVLGLLQYIFYPSLHPYLFLGWDDHFYRVFSTFLDPNFVGAFLVLYLFYIFYLLLQNYSHRNKRIFFVILTLLTLVAILLTYSRSAYLMLATGIIIYLWNLGQRKIIFGVIGILGIAVIFLGIFHHYGEGNNLLRTASISSRLGSMNTALTIFTKNPILGVGFDSYRYAQRKYGYLPGNVWEITHAGAGTSNSLLFILATTGAVGFLAYLFLLYTILRRANEKANKNKIQLAFLMASVILLILNSFFENTLFYPSIMLWIFAVVGFIG